MHKYGGDRYKDAGVDIDAGNAFIEAIKPLAEATKRPGVASNLGGFGALFDHGALDIAYMLAVQGMTVTAPKDGAEMLALVRLATEKNDGPWCVRWPRDAVPSDVPDLEEIASVEPLTWEILREGADCAILAVGSMVLPALEAADVLDAEGVKVSLIHI